MRSPLPIFALIALALMFVLGIVAFGASMSSVDAEMNGTATNATLIPYQIQYAWWFGMGILVLIIAIGFALWNFFG